MPILGTTEELFAVAALLLLGAKRKASAAATSDKADARAGKADPDGEGLLARANQQAAEDWVTLFENEGAPADYAEALARWAGIESSGNPLAVSSQGERGLLQLTATTQKEGALTSTEWDALISPSTTRQQHAHMAMELANWLWHKADALSGGQAGDHVDPVTDPVSAVWYAKLYHQRPVDVRDAHLHGDALTMARELAQAWAGDAAKMHRLRAANVVAFGNPDP
jgi:hypothetical protein